MTTEVLPKPSRWDRLRWESRTWPAFVCAGSFLVAAATHLPWYKSAESPALSARSPWLLPRPGDPSNVPGLRAWGELTGNVAVLVGVIVLVAMSVSFVRRERNGGTDWLTSVLAVVGATVLGGIVVSELVARPPYGDGPEMRAVGWGAFLAAVTAAVAFVGAWFALASAWRQRTGRSA